MGAIMKPFHLKTEQANLDQAYAKEIETGKAIEWRPKLQLNEKEMMCLVASLQLAMRHPVFPHRPPGQWCAEIINRLLSTIPVSRPALRALMEAGNNPAFDEITKPKQ